VSAGNNIPHTEISDLLKSQIADLVKQGGSLPKDQLHAVLQELMRLILEAAADLGLDADRVLQLAIGAYESTRH
jgi:fructose-1-phosphate kinase PfkB-like protein